MVDKSANALLTRRTGGHRTLRTRSSIRKTSTMHNHDSKGTERDRPPDDAQRPKQILAEEVRPGDRITDTRGLLDPFTVAKVKIDGGFVLITGGPAPWSAARREKVLRFQPNHESESTEDDEAAANPG
jgi:hypothetical protein